jgi:cytochrome b
MTPDWLIWAAIAAFTLLLIVLTWQVLTHDPAVCRTCVERAARARRRHPSFVPAEDRPEWGQFR